MTDAKTTEPIILQTFPLGAQWPTPDPFLFCAHHRDNYPKSNGEFGPAAELSGRQLGQDFADVDGWNMYHGKTVPGFPQHPHRGFETITYVREGICDHSDSLGAKARFGEGDVQWLTAGKGIVHSEMFPLLNAEQRNPLHLFQVWLNLPAANKMVEPYFSMYWADDLVTTRSANEAGKETVVTVVAGVNPDVANTNSKSAVAGTSAIEVGLEDTGTASAGAGADNELADQTVVAESGSVSKPPPDSWAANPANSVAMWHIKMDADASWLLPAADETDNEGKSVVNRTIYLFEGGDVTLGGTTLVKDTGAVLDAGRSALVESSRGGAELLVLQGRPIGEPVAQMGPFVMNDEEGIRQTIRDYQKTGFGGWPWPTDDPTHKNVERFAVDANGDPFS